VDSRFTTSFAFDAKRRMTQKTDPAPFNYVSMLTYAILRGFAYKLLLGVNWNSQHFSFYL
jgi:hypothetical protein